MSALPPFLRRLLPALLLGALLSSCATSTETDPTKVTTGDLMLGRERLDRHLEDRRKVLDGLQARASELETRLVLKLGALHAQQQALSATQRAADSAASELAQIKASTERGEAMLRLIAKTRADLEQAQRVAAAQDEAKIRQLKEDVARLEAEIEVINGEIDRGMRRREEQRMRDKTSWNESRDNSLPTPEPSRA